MARKSIGRKARTARNASKGRRILIIEDDHLSRELYDDLLQFFGYDTLLAANGEEGLVQARAARPDLILCDIRLPGMGGVEVMRELKADEALRHIPVVAVTIMSSTGHREGFLEAGFDGYMSKPTNPEVFIKEIEEYFH